MRKRGMKKNGRMYRFPDGTEYPIVECDVGLLAILSMEDQQKGIRTDPYNCAIACALKRQGDGTHATVSATRAYVVSTWEGEKVVLRFDVPPETREAMRAFDATGVIPEGGFRLTPVRKSQRSGNKKITNGKRNAPGYKPAYRNPRAGDRPAPITFRNLTGRIHTSAAA